MSKYTTVIAIATFVAFWALLAFLFAGHAPTVALLIVGTWPFCFSALIYCRNELDR